MSRPDARPVADPTQKSCVGSFFYYSYPSHPRVGLHPSQTRRTRCEISGNFGDPSQANVSLFEPSDDPRSPRPHVSYERRMGSGGLVPSSSRLPPGGSECAAWIVRLGLHR